jgi:hypothetical protein
VSRFVRFLLLPPADRRRATEAAAELIRASLELRLVPSSRVASLLGTVRLDETVEHVGAEQLREAGLTGRDVARAARHLPWHPTCLRQALAVRRMLLRRGISSQLHLGVTSPTVGEAHAWVTVGGEPVVGRPGLERFVPLAAFR